MKKISLVITLVFSIILSTKLMAQVIPTPSEINISTVNSYDLHLATATDTICLGDTVWLSMTNSGTYEEYWSQVDCTHGTWWTIAANDGQVMVVPTTTSSYFASYSLAGSNGTIYGECRQITIVVTTPAPDASQLAFSSTGYTSGDISWETDASGLSGNWTNGTLPITSYWQVATTNTWGSGVVASGNTYNESEQVTGLTINTDYYLMVQTANRCTTNFSWNVIGPFRTKPAPPSIYEDAGKDTICPGESVTLQIYNPSGTIQWYKNVCKDTYASGNMLNSANGIYQTPTVTTTYFADTYDGTNYSDCNSYTVTVVDNINITTQPLATQNINHGSNVTFTVSATNTYPLSYQWQYEYYNTNHAQMEWADVYNNGTGNSSSYTVYNVTSADIKNYRCVVSTRYCSVNSNAASFTVTTLAPSVATYVYGNTVASTTAQLGGNVSSDGGASVTERGVCWSTSSNPTTSDSKQIVGSGTGTFSSLISGLTASTTYYVRAYATNSNGTSYGSNETFTTRSPLVFHVSTSGNDANDGSTWALSKATIGKALEAALDGDEVWVAKGTYIPTCDKNYNFSYSANRENTFSLRNNVKMYGGFAGTETATSQRTNYGEGKSNETILSGDLGTSNTNDNVYHVVSLIYVSANTVVDGFTITKGYANYVANDYQHGAGIYIYGYGNSCNPTIDNCVVKDNFAFGCGGGLFTNSFYGSTNYTLSNTTFKNNRAESSGGAIAHYAHETGEYYGGGYFGATITNCSFTNNSSFVSGGAVYNTSFGTNIGSLSFTNCSFIENSSQVGGAVSNEILSNNGVMNPNFTNCSFIGNESTSMGAAISNDAIVSAKCNPNFYGCTFNENIANGAGGAIYNSARNEGEVSPYFINCQIRGNRGSDGGGMFNSADGGSSPVSKVNYTMINCVISGNYAQTNHGGGIYNEVVNGAELKPNLINVTITGNKAKWFGGGIYSNGSSSLIVAFKNSILWNNFGSYLNYGAGEENMFNDNMTGGTSTSTYSYSLAQNITTATNGNLDGTGMNGLSPNYPNLATYIDTNSISLPTTYGNFILRSSSAALNVGNNAVNNQNFDVMNNARVQSTTIDMGAYEGTFVAGKYYVATTGNDGANGKSWATAFATVGTALANVAGGDTIYIAKGTYYPTLTSGFSSSAYDNRYKTFNVKAGIRIYGGFAGSESQPSERVNYKYGQTNETILSGDIGTVNDISDNAYNVIWMKGSSTTNKFDGLTITKGNSDNSDGGGVLLDAYMYSNSSPSFTDCNIIGNNASSGGGIAVIVSGSGRSSNPTFTNCRISGNSANFGGGIYFVGDDAATCNPILTNCLISGNKANYGAGVINIGFATAPGTCNPTFINTTITSNAGVLNGTGGGVLNAFSNPTFTNCIIWNNKDSITIGTADANVKNYSGSETPSYNYSLVQGITTTANNCINGIDSAANENYPKFRAPINLSATGLPTVGGNFHLLANSVCLNAGDNSANTQVYDLSDSTRVLDSTIDLGAFEGIAPGCGAPKTSSQSFTECQGFSILVGSNTYTSSGTYADLFVSADGCDSIVTTTLIINIASSSSQTLTECEGYSITVGTHTYTTSGTYIDVLVAANGCDSTVTTNLTITPGPVYTVSVSGATNDSTCSGSSVTLNAYDNGAGAGGNNDIEFDGIDDYLSLSVPAAITYQSAFTIETMMNIDPSNPSYENPLFHAEDMNGMISLRYIADDAMGHKFVFMLASGPDFQAVEAAITLPGLVNQWASVAAVYDYNDPVEKMKIYVNGMLQPTTSFGPSIPMVSPAPANALIGYNNSVFLKGKLNDLRLWNVPRSSIELATAAGLCVEANPIGLVSEYRFDSETGGDLIDEVSAQTATLTGFNTSSCFAPSPVGCAGATPPSNLTFAWSGGITNNVAYAANATTTYTLTVTDTVTGCTATENKTITVTNADETNNITECQGYSITVGINTYTATGNYVDTISTGCGNKIVTTNLTINPNASSSQTLVECAGYTVTVGSHTYSTSGVYSDTLTSANGCDSLVTTNLTIKPVATFTQTLVKNFGESVVVGTNTYTTTGIYSDTLTAANGCDSIVTTNLTVNAGFDISGIITYDDVSVSPMNNVTVYLLQAAVKVDSTTSDANGAYLFATKAPGTYTLTASTIKAWGGSNATDALIVQNHFAGNTTLVEPRLTAADVNATGFVNTTDALFIQNRFNATTTSFPSGDWYFNPQSVTLVSADVTNDFKAICFGDVNASYTPPTSKLSPTVEISHLTSVALTEGVTVQIPVTVSEAMQQVGAVSLVLNYPSDKIAVTAVTPAVIGFSALMSNILNGQIRMAWSDLQSLNLNANDVLFTIDVTAITSDVSTINFETNGESEFADANATVFDLAKLGIPEINLGVTGLSKNASNALGLNVYPNPTSASAIVNYTLAESGKVTMNIFDVNGKVVNKVIAAEQSAGNHSIVIDVANLASGVYTCHFTCDNGTTIYTNKKSIVVNK